MALLFTSTLTDLLQRNTRLFLFPLLLLSFLLWYWMRPKFPFLSAASNVNLKRGDPLKWKKQLVKEVRILLPLTEVIKIVRLTSPLHGMPRQSSPRPRLRHGRRLALLSHLNLCILSFVRSLALRSHLPTLLTSPTIPLPWSRHRSSPPTWDLTFVSLSKMPCVAEPVATFPSSAEPRALRSLIPLFAFPSLPLNFLQLPQTSPPYWYWPRQSFLSHAKAPSSVWHKFSPSHFQGSMVFAFLSFHLEDIFYYSHPQDGKASWLSYFLSAYLSHFVRLKAFWTHHFITSSLFSGV